jgi:very-short-patch-repair endonuclease
MRERAPSKASWTQLQPEVQRLRRQQTPAEEEIWQRLRNRQLAGYKFRRQHWLHRFVVDFYCHEAGLIIEIDGPIHDEQEERDASRQEYLETIGLRLIRFSNDRVMNFIEDVLAEIERHCRIASSPSPRSGEGVGG